MMAQTEFSNYGDMLYNPTSNESDDLYVVVKYNKRLYIMNNRTKKLLYTPSFYLKVTSRELLKKTAESASTAGILTFNDILEFEIATKKKR
jgi:hypothetical protein